MDIFGHELDVQVIANYSEYIGKVSIEDNGEFDVNLESQEDNLFGTFGHFFGNIYEKDRDNNIYTIDYLFDQFTTFPEMIPLATFNNTATATAGEYSINFDNTYNDGVYISLTQPKKLVSVTEQINEKLTTEELADRREDQSQLGPQKPSELQQPEESPDHGGTGQQHKEKERLETEELADRREDQSQLGLQEEPSKLELIDSMVDILGII